MTDSTVQPTAAQVAATTPPAASPGSGHRIQGWILIGSAVLAVTGNVLHPRTTGDGVEDYRLIAGSVAWPVAALLIGIALMGLILGLVPICRAARGAASGARAAALDAAGLAMVVGGTIGIAQQGVDGIGLPRQAAAFTEVDAEWNAFPYWSADAVSAVNSSLAVAWYLIVLGALPVLLAVAYRSPRGLSRPVRVLAAVAGIATAATVAVITVGGGNGVTDALFLAGSLIVTGWFVVIGVCEVRASA
jgi:hypothetical protein